VFRALQEGLINIHRHAHANRAQVCASQEQNVVTLTIADDGRGIDLKRVDQFNSSGTGLGVGLASIFERLRDLGGACKLQSSPQGTEVCISVPAS
jgi:signal transduction histidine kinase